MKPRILVTGASGFIGRNLILALSHDWDVVALYHGSADFPAFLQARGRTAVKALRVDLRDAEAVRAALAPLAGVEAGVFLAANGDPARSVPAPAMDLQANTQTLINLLEAVAVERLVFFSSGAVYHGLQGLVSPASPVSPHLPYAISKWASEQYVKFFTHDRSRVGSHVIVRFFGAYGPHEPARKVYTRLVTHFGLERRREFTIRGDGRNLIDAMFVDDAVAGILAMLASEPVSRTVDFASGTPVTLDALVRTAAEVFGIHDAVIRHEGAVPEYIEFQASPQPFRDIFGVHPKVPLPEGLLRLHRHLQNESEPRP